MAGAEKYDLIGVLGWAPVEIDVQVIEQLICGQPAPIADDRHLIFVCPECGDLGCGAITARIQRDGEQITWDRFGYENDYDSNMSDFETFSVLGPFTFSSEQYAAVLRSILRRQDV
jgi:hypothetical protein